MQDGLLKVKCQDLVVFNSCSALQMLDYNVPGGKLNRGRGVADAVVAIKGKEVCIPHPLSEHLHP